MLLLFFHFLNDEFSSTTDTKDYSTRLRKQKMKNKEMINEAIELHKQKQLIDNQLNKIAETFRKKLHNLHEIAFSILRKINFEHDNYHNVFKNDFEFLKYNRSSSYNRYFSIKETNKLNKTVLFEYTTEIPNKKPVQFVVPVCFFNISDREFATLFRKHIQQYKSSTQHKKLEQVRKEYSSNKKLIDKAQKENEALLKQIRKLTKLEQERSKTVENNLLEKINKRQAD